MRQLIAFIFLAATLAFSQQPGGSGWMTPPGRGTLTPADTSIVGCTSGGHTGSGLCVRQTGATLITPTFTGTTTGAAATWSGVATFNSTVKISSYIFGPGGSPEILVGQDGGGVYFGSGGTSPAIGVYVGGANTTDVLLAGAALHYKTGAGVDRFFVTSSGGTFAGSVTTGAPTTGTAAPWKLGVIVTAACVLDATTYAQVEVNGVFRKVALCQ